MDYTTTRLAEEMRVPHNTIVKKVKKYAGSNKKAGGSTIYPPSNAKRLTIVKLGMTEVDGKKETIYQFAKADYDTCCADEARYYEKQREKSKARGRESAADPNSGLSRWLSFQKKATDKQMSDYLDSDRSGRDKLLDKVVGKK
tara:strand:+ start:3486 stop:3914 length:429 start_codon:yes stop_codon:yes gene_type:complete